MIGRNINKYMQYYMAQFRHQMRQLFIYQGQYNLMLFTCFLIYLDHGMERKILKDLERTVKHQRSLEKIERDIEIKDEKIRLDN